MRKRIHRPSPALVISLVALFVALGGTGYAAITITGKNVKNGSLTGKDIKNNSLTGSDVKESKLGTVPRATSATTAGSATSATNATNATNATTAGNGIKAYGTVTSTGTVIPALSKGITATRVSLGIYCVAAPGVSNTGRTPIATPDYQDGSGADHTVQFVSDFPCANGGWAFRTQNNGTTLTDIRFAVIIP